MSIQTGPKGQWTPTTPWLGPKKKTIANWPTYVCRNPSCKSYGRSHPNCRCGAPGNREDLSGHQTGMSLAHGGEVHHCSEDRAHHESCEHFADGGTVGANREFAANPALAVDNAIARDGLLHTLTKTGKSKHPEADLLESCRKGRKELKAHCESHFNPKHEHPYAHKDSIHALKEHMDDMELNPGKLLNVGSGLGLPEHAGVLGAKAAMVSSYLQSIKPKGSQAGPLDPVMPPSKMEENGYNRQLGIVENPVSVLQHVKDGTILPDDLHTLQNVHPHLLDSMQKGLTRSLIDAKAANKPIPTKHRSGLGSFLGDPMNYTMSQPGLAAMMTANTGAISPSQGTQKRSGATAATQKTIGETNDLYKTKLDKLQTDKS